MSPRIVRHRDSLDPADPEILIADRYLEALLAAADRQAADVPGDASIAPELRDVARVLRRSLLRIHPSFRFEERLAQRLADLAATQPREPGTVIPFPRPAVPVRALPDVADPADPLLEAILAGRLDPAAAEPDAGSRVATARRPLLVGGALTSAALSLVGVVFVAWRASRPAGRASAVAMSRAARAAHARQAMTAGLTGGGIGGPA